MGAGRVGEELVADGAVPEFDIARLEMRCRLGLVMRQAVAERRDFGILAAL